MVKVGANNRLATSLLVACMPSGSHRFPESYVVMEQGNRRSQCLRVGDGDQVGALLVGQQLTIAGGVSGDHWTGHGQELEHFARDDAARLGRVSKRAAQAKIGGGCLPRQLAVGYPGQKFYV